MTRIALDASTLIYFVEGSDPLRERITRRLDVVRADPAGQLVASRLAPDAGLTKCADVKVEVIAP